MCNSVIVWRSEDNCKVQCCPTMWGLVIEKGLLGLLTRFFSTESLSSWLRIISFLYLLFMVCLFLFCFCCCCSCLRWFLKAAWVGLGGTQRDSPTSEPQSLRLKLAGFVLFAFKKRWSTKGKVNIKKKIVEWYPAFCAVTTGVRLKDLEN